MGVGRGEFGVGEGDVGVCLADLGEALIELHVVAAFERESALARSDIKVFWHVEYLIAELEDLCEGNVLLRLFGRPLIYEALGDDDGRLAPLAFRLEISLQCLLS